MTIVHLTPFWGMAFYRRPGKQAWNIKNIFQDPQIELWLGFDCLFVVPRTGLWRTPSAASQGASTRSEMLMKSEVSIFRFITTTLPSVLHLKPQVPTATHKGSDRGTCNYSANRRGSHHAEGVAMSHCLLKDFFALNEGNQPLIWRQSKIFGWFHVCWPELVYP